MIAHYRSRVSGPLLDRFDVQVEMPAVSIADLRQDGEPERSEIVAARVAAARRIQEERFAGSNFRSNAAMTPDLLRRHARVEDAGRRVLSLAMTRLGLSARAHDGVLKVARTIADLDGSVLIQAAHVAESVQYRMFDRPLLSSRISESENP